MTLPLSDDLLDEMAADLAERLTDLTERTYGRFGGVKSMPPPPQWLPLESRPRISWQQREAILTCEWCGRKLADHSILETCRPER